MENNTAFNYTYSAPQNAEVMAIRNKYLPRKESRLEELKRLDHEVRMSGLIESLTMGIIGCLLFGLGMCLAMKILGNSMVLGVVVGIIGAAIMVPAYPVYRAISGKVRAKLTPRILELANELAGGNEVN